MELSTCMESAEIAINVHMYALKFYNSILTSVS